MPIQFLSDTLVKGDFTFHESSFTTINGTGGISNNFTVDLNAGTNNYTLTFINGSGDLLTPLKQASNIKVSFL